MRFQSRWFWVAAAALVALNLFVYFWWANRPLVTVKTTEINRDLVVGLRGEAERLQQILDAACGTPGLDSYKRGEIGPVQSGGSPTVTPPTEPSASVLAQDKLVALLEAATVRVLVFGADHKFQGHGTGFFIDQNTLVTNRHVIENGRSFAITSRVLGKEPIPVRLIAATRDSEYTNPDFAILRADKVPPGAAKLAIATEPQVLQTVVAAGYPSSDIRVDADVVTPNTVFSQGEVSVLQRQRNNMVLVLHTAKIATGSSGGPLVNRCGNVVGVNTFIGAQEDKFSDRSLYALSAAALRTFLDQSGQSYTKMSSECASPPKN
ncbi:MAG: serine protease [Betaproteobacteria bacterium]